MLDYLNIKQNLKNLVAKIRKNKERLVLIISALFVLTGILTNTALAAIIYSFGQAHLENSEQISAQEFAEKFKNFFIPFPKSKNEVESSKEQALLPGDREETSSVPQNDGQQIKIERFDAADINDESIQKLADQIAKDFKYVKFAPVENAKAVAIFIPQIHENTDGTVSNEAKNTQFEIYEILKILKEKYGINFIAIEGAFYGPVPESAVSEATQNMELNSQLKDAYTELRSYCEEKGYDVDRLFSKIDRDIQLTSGNLENQCAAMGGPLMIEAKLEDEVLVYGLQNKETYEKSKEIAQKKYFIENQLSRLGVQPDSLDSIEASFDISSLIGEKSPNIGNLSKGQLSPDIASRIEELKQRLEELKIGGGSDGSLSLFGFFSRDSLSSDLASLKKEAETKNDSKLMDLIQKISDIAEKIRSIQAAKMASTSKSTIVDTEQSNPYAKITNVSKLKQLKKEVDDEFYAIAWHKRSQEAAENFETGLNEINQKSGVIVYGAKHEDIIDYLKEKNIATITVIPDTVATAYYKMQ